MTNDEMIENIVHAQNCLNSVWNQARKSTNVSLQIEGATAAAVAHCATADKHLEEALTLLGYYNG